MWNERERDRRARERGMCGHLCASDWEAHKYVRGCNIPGGVFACGDEEDRARARGGGYIVLYCEQSKYYIGDTAEEYVCGCARDDVVAPTCARV